MGKHSAPRRPGPLAVTTGAAALAATAVFATTLADGGHPVPSAAAASHESGTQATPTSTPVPTSTRGEDPDRAARSVRRTTPPAGETGAPAPATAPTPGATAPAPGATATASSSATASPTAARSASPSATSSATPTATATPTASPSPSTPGVVTQVVDGVTVIVGGLLP